MNPEQIESKISEHSEAIAVLRQIAEDTNKYMAEFSVKLDKLNDNYISMQGTLKIVMDIKESLTKNYDDHEARMRKLESFIDNLKGKIAVWAGIGGLAGGLITTIVAILFKK